MTGTEHILLCLLREKECYAVRFLMQLGADPIYCTGSCVKAWTFWRSAPIPAEFYQKETAHTALLDKFGRDLTQKARSHQLDPVIGREQEIERVIRILCRRSKTTPVWSEKRALVKLPSPKGLPSRLHRAGFRLRYRASD